jgi:hypothetical protein
MSVESAATVETAKQPTSDELWETKRWSEIEVSFSNYCSRSCTSGGFQHFSGSVLLSILGGL